MNKSLNGKRILVTGGCQGIGKGIVVELWKLGAVVVTLSNQPENLQKLKKEYPSIDVVCVDLRDWDKTREVVQSLGVFDGLVNNAGIAIVEPFLECSSESFDAQLVGTLGDHGIIKILLDYSITKFLLPSFQGSGVSIRLRCDFELAGLLHTYDLPNKPLGHYGSRTMLVNVRAIINVSQIVSKKMIENSIEGSIVNISSQASKSALKDHVAYCASKGAVDSATRVMALELGPYGIRVNTVNPTVVMTEMGKKVWLKSGKAQDMQSKIPLGRFGEVHEVVNAVLFLLGNGASMISGVQLPVDGGFLAT